MNLDIYQDFVRNLEQKLLGQLPGIEAHLTMAPPQRFKGNKAILPPADAKKACVLLLLYWEDNHINLPLIVRPQTATTHSGQVAFPGGRYEEEDKNFIRTALRETEEEIGVVVGESQVIGKLSEIYIPPSNYLVYPIVAYLESKPRFEANHREVAEILQIRLEDLQNANTRKIKETVWHNQKVDLPYYDLHHQTIWGATAMIIAEFLEITPKIDNFL